MFDKDIIKSALIPQAFVFIGRSGSGKGTQADLLIKKLKELDPTRDVLYIQTGQEFRKFIQGQSFTEKLSAEYYKTDKLQLEFLAIKMWVDFLVDNYHGDEHIILDGTPRKLYEAKVLDSVFGFYGFGVADSAGNILNKPHVINIDISPKEAEKRLLLRNRLDDAEEDVFKRLSWYETDVVPTVEYYRDNSAFHFLKINGEHMPEEVHADIVSDLGFV